MRRWELWKARGKKLPEEAKPDVERAAKMKRARQDRSHARVVGHEHKRRVRHGVTRRENRTSSKRATRPTTEIVVVPARSVRESVGTTRIARTRVELLRKPPSTHTASGERCAPPPDHTRPPRSTQRALSPKAARQCAAGWPAPLALLNSVMTPPATSPTATVTRDATAGDVQRSRAAAAVHKLAENSQRRTVRRRHSQRRLAGTRSAGTIGA